MRKVFSNSMVAHVWAQQTQSEGRSANGNFYFDGPTIYSYRSSFPVAHFTDRTIGSDRVVLFTAHDYSTSTSHHKTLTRRGLHGLHVVEICVDNVTPGYGGEYKHAENIAGMVAAFEKHAADCTKVRKQMWFGWDAGGNRRVEDTADQRIDSLAVPESLTRYCAAFDLPLPDLGLEAKWQAVRAAFAKHNDPKAVAKRTKDAGKRQLKYAAAMGLYHAWLEGVTANPPRLDTLPKPERRTVEWRLQDERLKKRVTLTPEQWQNGKGEQTALGYYRSLTLVRRIVSGTHDRLETSRGAEVPFQHAVMVFLRAQDCRSKSREWHRNGEQITIGHFQLDSVDAQGNIRAGCHTIAWDEMLRLALREIPQLVKAPFPLPVLVAA